MNILFLIGCVLAFAVNSISIRGFQLKCSAMKCDTDLFQASFCLVGALTYALSGGFQFDLSLNQTMYAILFGLFFAGAVIFIAECYACGPMSVTSVIVNSCVIIPLLYSCISLKEPITSTQLIGCLFLAVTFILSAFSSESKEQNGINIKWLIFVLIAFVSNGTTAVIQKNYKLSAPDSDGNMFMAIAYFTAAVILMASFIIKQRKEEKKHISTKNIPLTLLLILVAGLGSFVGNGILMKLSNQLSAALLYPFVNGGICVTVSVFSVLFFKEKLTVKKALTIITGLAAVIILNL